MADWTKQINDTPHRVEREKVEREKRWDIYVHKIDFETDFSTNAAKRKIKAANDKKYIIVYPLMDIEKLRYALQKFVNEESLAIETKGIVLYMHHNPSILNDAPYEWIKGKVQRTASHHAYLITVPENIPILNFSIWVQNLLYATKQMREKADRG